MQVSPWATAADSSNPLEEYGYWNNGAQGRAVLELAGFASNTTADEAELTQSLARYLDSDTSTSWRLYPWTAANSSTVSSLPLYTCSMACGPFTRSLRSVSDFDALLRATPMINFIYRVCVEYVGFPWFVVAVLSVYLLSNRNSLRVYLTSNAEAAELDFLNSKLDRMMVRMKFLEKQNAVYMKQHQRDVRGKGPHAAAGSTKKKLRTNRYGSSELL